MEKKFLSLLLALAMCLSLSVPAWAVETSASSIGDDFLEFYANTSTESLISESNWTAIKKDFSDELNYVSATQGLRTDTPNISKAIMTAINRASMTNADNPNYNFSVLTETIADMAFENALDQFNNSHTKAHPGQTEMRNVVRTTVVSEGALRGKFVLPIMCGDSFSGGIGLSIPVGVVVRGVSIGVAANFSCQYTINAHPTGTIIGTNGLEATHSAIFGILFGYIERCSYDLYDSYTDELIGHYDSNIIRNGELVGFKFAVVQGSPSYLKHASSSHVSAFPTISAYRSAVEANPHLYV